MLSGNRLKLGPKRKESLGFHRIHKVHQESSSENSQPVKVSLLGQHQILDSKSTERDFSVLRLGSPRTHLHQIDLTSNTGSEENKTQTIGIQIPVQGTENTAPSSQVYEIKQLNQELLQRIVKLQQENKELTCHQQAQRKSTEVSIGQKNVQLHKKIAQLTQENQLLKNKEKRLQAELSSIDRDHYEREIRRLKSECQKLQIEALQKDHLNYTLQEQSKDHDRLMSSKNQEIKNCQKQVQKNKMALIEARSQFSQKQRGIRVALEESEAANQVLCRSLEEMSKQIQRQEALRKEKSSNADHLQKQIEVLLARGRDSEANCIKIRKNYEEQLAEQSKRMVSVEQEQRVRNRESEALISRLSCDLQAMKKMKQTEELAASKVVDQLKQEGQQIERALKVVRLEEEIKEMIIKIDRKDQLIFNLESRLKQYFSPEQYQGLEKRCRQLQEKRLASARYYQEKLYNYQKENDSLRLEKINKAPHANQGASFDDTLKKTIQESQSLRAQLKRMTETLAASKEEAAEIRQREKGYLNELQILRRKAQSSSKNFSIELQVQKQKLVNQIDTLSRRLKTAETRLEYKVSENKQKDQFIKSVIVGRSDPMERQTVLAELERIFLERDKRRLEQLE